MIKMKNNLFYSIITMATFSITACSGNKTENTTTSNAEKTVAENVPNSGTQPAAPASCWLIIIFHSNWFSHYRIIIPELNIPGMHKV